MEGSKKFHTKNQLLEEELRDINEKLKFEEFVKHHTLTIRYNNVIFSSLSCNI